MHYIQRVWNSLTVIYRSHWTSFVSICFSEHCWGTLKSLNKTMKLTCKASVCCQYYYVLSMHSARKWAMAWLKFVPKTHRGMQTHARAVKNHRNLLVLKGKAEFKLHIQISLLPFNLKLLHRRQPSNDLSSMYLQFPHNLRPQICCLPCAALM